VAKVVPRSGGTPSLPRVASTPAWKKLAPLSLAQVAELELEPEIEWTLAVRPEVEGRTLAEAVDSIDPVDAAVQLVRGLRDLHETGVIHGDIQPQNVVVGAEGALQFIDVQLAPIGPNEPGYVAGSAPLMAPEIWEGQSPDQASDRYALATLLVWFGGDFPLSGRGLSDWALAHREGTPSLDHAEQVFDRRITSILRRMLARHPDERPPLQELLDALQPSTVETPMVTSLRPHRRMIEEVVDELETSGSRTALAGVNRSDLDIVLDSVARILEYRGRFVAELGRRDASTPWAPVLEMLEALGSTHDFRPDGDQIRVFDELSDLVFVALGKRPATILWREHEGLSVDLAAWWNHLGQRAKIEGHDLSFLVVTSEDAPHRLEPIDSQLWDSWRASTLRAEVRGIPQKRWAKLVEEHGEWLSTMRMALDRELGVETPEAHSVRRDWNTAGLVAVGASFEDDVERLMAQCAFGEAAARCQAILEAIEKRSKMPAGVPDAGRVLELWVEAATRGARGVIETRELQDALERHEIGRASCRERV